MKEVQFVLVFHKEINGRSLVNIISSVEKNVSIDDKKIRRQPCEKREIRTSMIFSELQKDDTWSVRQIAKKTEVNC